MSPHDPEYPDDGAPRDGEPPRDAQWSDEPAPELPELRPEDRPDLFGEPEIPSPYEEQRYEEQPYEPQPYQPPYQAPQQTYAPAEPYIPMPNERGGRASSYQVRDAQKNLDLDLGRIKRRKRYGFFTTTISVLFVAFFIAPVTWVGIYRFIDAPGTLLMMTRAASGESIQHQPIGIARMSPHIVRAVIAAEDANFCTHDGFDVEAIQDAMESNARGGRTRGASTISQQTAKNLFLWPERSWIRKGLETYFTALIEFMWPKQRIMEHYLNVAEWGDGIFGVQAAARARFGVDAEDLTPLQAARLAAVLPSPNRWRADNPGPYVRRRAATIVQRARVVRNEHMSGCVLSLDRAGA